MREPIFISKFSVYLSVRLAKCPLTKVFGEISWI